MLIYLDTCIVIYSVEGRASFQQRAQAHIAALEAVGGRFLVSDLLKELSSCLEVFDFHVLTHTSLLQELLGRVKAEVQSLLELTVSNLRLAVLLHEINPLGVAVEIDGHHQCLVACA